MIKFSLLFISFVFAFRMSDNEKTSTYHEDTTQPKSTMMLVEGGTFLMGSNDGREHEKPVHKVTVSDFYISQYEVTVGDYLKFVTAAKDHYPEWMEPSNKYNIKTGSDKSYRQMGEPLTARNHPLVGVSWQDAKAYCVWLSKKDKMKYRLPTEAEWEFAARGGNESQGYLYSGSDSLDLVAWYKDNENERTHPVGKKISNELGLYDMSGNVCEWVADDYGAYTALAQTDPINTSDYGAIIFRGGGFRNSDYQCTTTFRNDNSRNARILGIGFRVAASK